MYIQDMQCEHTHIHVGKDEGHAYTEDCRLVKDSLQVVKVTQA